MNITIIAAIARNGVIGKSDTNDLPWGRSYPEDLARFKALTMGHAVIMGRRTWESLPPKQRPLPNRLNVVVTSSLDAPPLNTHVRFAGSLPLALDLADRAYTGIGWNRARHIFVIGGARLFAEALPLATTLELTLIDRDWEGDVFWPGFVEARSLRFVYAFMETQGFDCVASHGAENPDLRFTRWERRQARKNSEVRGV